MRGRLYRQFVKIHSKSATLRNTYRREIELFRIRYTNKTFEDGTGGFRRGRHRRTFRKVRP
jgi:hypothetical protein